MVPAPMVAAIRFRTDELRDPGVRNDSVSSPSRVKLIFPRAFYYESMSETEKESDLMVSGD